MYSRNLFSTIILAVAVMAVTVYCSDEDQFDGGVFSSVDLISPENEVIRYKIPRSSDWCQYVARNYPAQYWNRQRSLDGFPGIRKRGYMGIEIPDFITNQDGSLQGGGSATGSKPRYFKNG